MAVVLVASGCTDLFGPDFPAAAQAFAAPPVYANWWAVVQECAGTRRSFSAVRWYSVPADFRLQVRGADVDGVVYEDQRVVLREEFRMNGSLVRHEMLHLLTRNISGHPAEYFQQKCGGVVTCELQCRADGGTRAPDTLAARPVDERELELEGQAVPDQLHPRDADAIVSVLLRIRNPFGWPVRVALRDADGGSREQFAVALRSVRTGETVLALGEIAGVDAVTIEPNGVRRGVLDLKVATILGRTEDRLFEVLVSFARATSVADTVEVIP
jgi:hypothetical protein